MNQKYNCCPSSISMNSASEIFWSSWRTRQWLALRNRLQFKLKVILDEKKKRSSSLKWNHSKRKKMNEKPKIIWKCLLLSRYSMSFNKEKTKIAIHSRLCCRKKLKRQKFKKQNDLPSKSSHCFWWRLAADWKKRWFFVICFFPILILLEREKKSLEFDYMTGSGLSTTSNSDIRTQRWREKKHTRTWLRNEETQGKRKRFFFRSLLYSFVWNVFVYTAHEKNPYKMRSEKEGAQLVPGETYVENRITTHSTAQS